MGRNQREKVNQKRKKRRIFPSLFLCACQRAVNRGAGCRTANRGFYLVLKTALSSRHRLCKCSCKQGQILFLQKINMQTPKFSPAFFKRRRNPKAAPLVALRTGRNSFLQGSAGGEAKQSGGLFCRGEPSPGVPRCRRAHRIRAGSWCVPFLSYPGISFGKILRAAVEFSEFRHPFVCYADIPL